MIGIRAERDTSSRWPKIKNNVTVAVGVGVAVAVAVAVVAGSILRPKLERRKLDRHSGGDGAVVPRLSLAGTTRSLCKRMNGTVRSSPSPSAGTSGRPVC